MILTILKDQLFTTEQTGGLIEKLIISEFKILPYYGWMYQMPINLNIINLITYYLEQSKTIAFKCNISNEKVINSFIFPPLQYVGITFKSSIIDRLIFARICNFLFNESKDYFLTD